MYNNYSYYSHMFNECDHIKHFQSTFASWRDHMENFSLLYRDLTLTVWDST